MPVFLENYNLDWVNEQEDDLLAGLLGMTIKEGTQVNGYSEYPSFYYKFGKAEIHVQTTKNDEQENGVKLDRWDTHASGNCVWDLLCTGMDITPDDGTKTERVMLFRNYDVDRGSFIPIHVLNPDVLPSYLEGDRVKLQVVGLPTSIRYHENAEQFEASLPKDEDGNTWGIAEGTLFPSGFLVNHAVGNTETNSKNQITDSYIAFRGVVKDLRTGKVEMLGQELDPFIRCYIDTNLGELELDHSIKQVSEDQRKNMKIGATVEGVCVISGDAAIYEHDKDIVKDFDHDLAALRFVVENKVRAEHLKRILAKYAEYTSVSGKWTYVYVGLEDIIGRLNHVQDAQKAESTKVFAHYAVITDKEVNELPHGIDERCLVLAYDDPDKYASIMFISVDEEGMITKIDVTNDSRYRFRIEDHKVLLSPEDIPVPERCADGMRMRAKFFHMLPDYTATDDLFALQNVEKYESNAEMIMREVKADGVLSSETLANIFGYLFVKSIESNIQQLFEVWDGRYLYSGTPITVEDAKNGNSQSSFPMPIQKGFQRAFDKGRQFEKDFSLRFKESDVGSEAYYSEMISALTAAQSIGELYGPIFIERIVEKEPVVIPQWLVNIDKVCQHEENDSEEKLMRKLYETALIEEAARAGVDEDTTVGMIKDLRQSKINPKEVLDNLYKMTPPYIDAAVAKAMADTHKAHRKKRT